MNKFEICFKGWAGANGKRFRPYYCKQGFNFDSKTDEQISFERCQDWFDRCEYLRERRQRVPKL